MNRRLVLLNLPFLRAKDPRATLGDASLRARLTRDREIDVASVTWAVNTPSADRGALADALMDELGRSYPMLGVGCYVWNEPVVQWLLPELRRRGFRGTIVLGGPQITYAGAGVDRDYPHADIFIRGYGEDALANLVRGNGPAGAIAGVSYAGRDHAVTFAKVDYGLLESPIVSGLLPLGGFQRWETQRGCLYRCAFCQWPGGIDGMHRLARKRIESESEMLAGSATEEIAIQDPIFNSDPNGWLAPLAALERHGYRGRLSMQLRPETFTGVNEFLRLSLAHRCKLEFGLQTIHPEEMEVIQRNNHLGKCREVFAALREAGGFVEISLIYGLPNQTLDSFRRSVDFALKHATSVRAFPLLLLRGTPLHGRQRELGLVEDDSVIPQVVAAPTFTRDDHQKMAAIARELGDDADALVTGWRAGG
ncbi:MAG: B12-binding domain-containing radical SAM protein [Planctomycetes bacterium]|nr:B12-binding domain-containing radical SAM protein [Planctomycetota bacterium]